MLAAFKVLFGIGESALLFTNGGDMFLSKKMVPIYLAFAAIVAIPVFVLSIIGFFKDKKLIGYYKSTKIFGRLYSFFAVSAVLGGFVGFVFSILMLIGGGEHAKYGWLYLGLSAVVLAAGVFMYLRIINKVPDFLKKSCIMDLTLCGLGTNLRVAFFIMLFIVGFGAWFGDLKPTEYKLDDGRTVNVYPDGRVYDPYSGKVGKASDDRKTVIWD